MTAPLSARSEGASSAPVETDTTGPTANGTGDDGETGICTPEAADQGSIADGDDDASETTHGGPARSKRSPAWSRIVVFAVLPGIALLLAAGASVPKWQDSAARAGDSARIASLRAAQDGTVLLLSYTPGTVDKDLAAARELLTGPFRDSYTSLTNDVVVPGAKQKQISAVATVPAAASVSASANRAVALVFVDQSVVIGGGAPTATASSVRVTLERIGDRWLISGFDPV